MQVNRPSAFVDTHPAQVNAAQSASASSSVGAAGPSRVNLKSRVTPRTENYLQRLRAHGTSTQRLLASSACDALAKDLFIPNPAREKPVVQFGVSAILDEKKGLLLANFMPHDDKLELEALAFRAERYFETEAGSITKVILEHARELSEVKAEEPSSLPSATAKLPELKQRSQGDIAEEQKALKKDVERFDKQSMQRKMASKLADMRVNDGRSNSRMTALPVAHVTIAGARLRKLATAPFQKVPDKQSQPPSASVPATTLSTPRGLQYEFSKQEFADFHEEHWLPAEDARSADTSETSSFSSSEENTHDADFAPRPDRRNGQFMSDNIRAQLERSLDQNVQTSASRREGRVFDEDLLQQLSQRIERDQSPT